MCKCMSYRLSNTSLNSTYKKDPLGSFFLQYGGEKMKSGKLYICPTPIGNLEDITIRALNILKEVDLIAAEDTRNSIKLLNHYEIKKPLTSYHKYNIKEKGNYLIERIQNGENIALISDAGMPGISDPGEELIKLAIENEVEVVGLPGATASITALVVSGLKTEKFVFEGFLSSKNSDRKKELKDLKGEFRTIIFYESPHRLLKTLEDMKNILGNRKIAIARELTKYYEEVFRGNIEEAIDSFSNRAIKGEFALVLEGAKPQVEEVDIEAELKKYIEDGFSKKEAVKKLSDEKKLSRNLVYKISLKI